MKTAIFYFTGTGNSLFTAKLLKENLKGEVELISISKCLKEGISSFKYDKIGFSYPLYCFGIPVIVSDFIKNSEFTGVKYSFSVTSSGITPGFNHNQIETLLAQKNIKLNNYKTVYFTSNYIRKFNVAPEVKLKKKRETAEKDLIEFSKSINDSNNVKIPKGSFLKLIGNKFYEDWKESLDKSAASFVTDNNCNGCGTCTKLCPANNIKVEDGKVVWAKKCQDCLSCIHNCPKSSIQIPEQTETTGRYINPKITLKELIETHSA